MKDEISECKNEKASNARKPEKTTIGKSNQTLVYPAKLNPVI